MAPLSRAALRLVVVVCLALACRRGGIGGTGAPCVADDQCRAGYRCVVELGACAPAGEQPKDAAADTDRPGDVAIEADREGDLAIEAPVDTWTPTGLPGLVLWLDAGEGVERDALGGVSRWTDRSGQGNHARQDVVAMRPVVGMDRDRPVLIFRPGGVLLRVTDNDQLRWGTDDFSVFIVASTVNQYWSPPLFMHKQEAFSPWVGWLLTGPNMDAAEQGPGRLCAQLRYLDVRLCSAESGHDDGALVLFGVQRTGGTRLALRVNGRASAEDEVPLLDVSAAGQDLFIGGHGSQPTFQLQGVIAEVVAVRGPMGDGDRETLERHLLRKYRLAGN